MPGSTVVAHGGPANFARRFSAFAVNEGHEWIGLVRRPAKGTKMRIGSFEEASPHRFVPYWLPEAKKQAFLKTQKRIDPRLYFADEVLRLRRFIQTEQPDILFLNGYSVTSWLLLEAAAREGLPIVIQHAGIACIEYEIYKHLYTKRARETFLEMERDIVRQASLQIFLNAYSQEVFARRVLSVPKDQAVIVPLPYEGEKWISPRRSQQIQETIIGCVARWDRIKNHDAILALAREVERQRLPWRFESVTAIPPTNVSRRLKTAYRKHIMVHSPMNRDALAAFYRRMDLLILPSHFDVSPTVVMEAASSGKPTLISPTVGWVSEYCACGLDDWIVDFEKPKKVIRRIQQLLPPHLPPSFPRYLRRHHAPKRIFRRYLHLFTDVVSYAHRSTRV